MQAERSPSRKLMQNSLIFNTPEQYQNGRNRIDFSINAHPLRRSYVQDINESNYYPNYPQQLQSANGWATNLSKSDYQVYPENAPQSQYHPPPPYPAQTTQLKPHAYVVNNSSVVQTIHNNSRQARTPSTSNLTPMSAHPHLLSRPSNAIKETAKSQQKEKHLSQQLKQLLQEITEKHLPQLVSQATKELFEDMKSIKAELLSYKNEIKSFQRRQEEVTSNLAGMAGLEQRVKDSLHSLTELNELQRNYFLLENKYNQIESKNNQRFKQLVDEMKREVNVMKDGNKHGDWKVSGIKSKLPTIMLEYKQMFELKGETVTVSRFTYNIDAQGYLMDSEKRYLVDYKGAQIRLEDKHLKLLGIYNVLK